MTKRKKGRGLLLVVSGPSGTGKGSVLEAFYQIIERGDIYYSISMTTRKPRPGEVHGVHYFFTTREEFEQGIAAGAFLEHTQYLDNYYGTPRDEIEKQRDDGRDVILEIESDGAFQIRRAVPDARLIFILPPGMAALEQRLRGRGTEDERTILRRLERAKEEIAKAGEYDYIILNDRLEEAADDLRAVIRAEKSKAAYMAHYMKEMF